jgi:O-antigen ligase
VKTHIFSYILTISLCMTATSAAFHGTTETVIQTSSLLLLFGTGLIFFGKNFIMPSVYRQSAITGVLTLLFTAVAIVGALRAEDEAYSLSVVAGMAVCLAASAGSWSGSHEQVRAGLSRFCIITALGMFSFWASHSHGSRFDETFHPNYWGLLGYVTFCLAGLIESLYLGAAVRAVSILIILAAQSRGALLATGVAAAVLAFYKFRSIRTNVYVKAEIFVAALAVTMSLIAVFSERAFGLLSQLFLLDDPYRGGASGFSGRNELWQAGLDVFYAHPWFGVGAGMLKYFITAFGDIDHAHNGYLNTLDQFGAIGGGLFFLLLGMSCWRLAKIACARTPGSSVGVATLAGYTVLAIFEPRLINIGNPLSVVALMFMLQPSERAPFRIARNTSSRPKSISRRDSERMLNSATRETPDRATMMA